MRILIVEDDRDLAAALDDALRFEGYATRVAYNGLEAVRMLAEQSIDIVLLDRDLPIMSGDAVMETIASNDIPVSVLMLTAAAQVRDRINGLELGADDYLIKPFAYPELLARIRALQRRAGKGDFSGTEFSHNGIVLDTVRHTVTRDGKPVNLSPKEYGVLLEIMKADGSYVNAEELFDTVWAGASPPKTPPAAMAIHAVAADSPGRRRSEAGSSPPYPSPPWRCWPPSSSRRTSSSHRQHGSRRTTSSCAPTRTPAN